jgi:hypothetical protein
MIPTLLTLFASSSLFVSSSLLVAVANDVPIFNLGPTCAGAAPTAGGGGRGSDVCQRSELAARDQLAQHWSDFLPADRRRCVELTHMARMPSYVQVLTCLEMAREARELAASRGRETVGTSR